MSGFRPTTIHKDRQIYLTNILLRQEHSAPEDHEKSEQDRSQH